MVVGAVARAEDGATVDREYLATLSADALPALRRLPSVPDEASPANAIDERIGRADGAAGFNWSRARAR